MVSGFPVDFPLNQSIDIEYSERLSIWMVKRGYPKNWLIHTENRLKSVVLWFLSFDPYSYLPKCNFANGGWIQRNAPSHSWLIIPIEYGYRYHKPY